MLSGQEPATDEWRELDGFVQDLREAVPARPLASEDLHVAAMVETSHLIADKGDPVVRPDSNADAPAPQVSWLPKPRRKQMKRSTRTLVRVLAPLAAVLTVMGSMAVAGALPHTVQKAVSHAAGTVGLNLPGDEEAPTRRRGRPGRQQRRPGRQQQPGRGHPKDDTHTTIRGPGRNLRYRDLDRRPGRERQQPGRQQQPGRRHARRHADGDTSGDRPTTEGDNARVTTTTRARTRKRRLQRRHPERRLAGRQHVERRLAAATRRAATRKAATHRTEPPTPRTSARVANATLALFLPRSLRASRAMLGAT